MNEPKFSFKLDTNKKATCCETILESGTEVYFFERIGPRKVLVGVPYEGTYSLHKINLRNISNETSINQPA